ncbi:MAG: hypothetical protein ACF8NJ_09100 [Phycisphaerales bacterium JB038]
MRLFSSRSTATLAALLMSTGAATAGTTVYNNFGPDYGGFDYNWGLGWTIAGENVAAQYGVEQAFQFVPSEGGALSDIWVPMWYVPIDAGIDEVVLRLVANTNNAYPLLGDVMEEWTISDFESWSDWSEPHHLVSDGGSLLEAGVSYWLWAAPTTDTTWAGWCMNIDPALTLPHTLRREGEDWLALGNSTAPALRVDVVPAPASFSALGLGALLTVRRRR